MPLSCISSIITCPTPLVVMLISPLLAVVVIVSLSIIMSSTNTFPIFASDQLSNDVPNLYVLSILGTISLSILALILIDHSDFGGEIRSIASASVYGNYGIHGTGSGSIVYAIGMNLAYIGTGKDVTNDNTAVIQANEVVANSDANIYFSTVDHKGDFRVGDLFRINQGQFFHLYQLASLRC